MLQRNKMIKFTVDFVKIYLHIEHSRLAFFYETDYDLSTEDEF